MHMTIPLFHSLRNARQARSITFTILKRTSRRMDGSFDVIDVLDEAHDTWTSATIRAMELEDAHRGVLHNGRSIQYDVL